MDDFSAAHDPRQRQVFELPGDTLYHPKDLVQRATEGLIRVPAGELTGDSIEVSHQTIGISRNHGIGDAGQGDLEPFTLGFLRIECTSQFPVADPGTLSGRSQDPPEQGDGWADDEEADGELGPGFQEIRIGTRTQEEVGEGQPGEGQRQRGWPVAAVDGGNDDG